MAGGLQQKVLALRKELETGVMREVLMQQAVRESIYRAVASGTVRTPVQPTCIAGVGSTGVPGTASPAIERPCGVKPRRGGGQSH